VNLSAVAKIVPAGIVPAVEPFPIMLYSTTSVAMGKKFVAIKAPVPVDDPRLLIEAITMSPS
jgi:hypothetical protein